MATAVISVICVALIIMGGMTMSRGILTTSDTTALSVEEMSTREGVIMRTEVDTLRATYLSWSNLMRITVDNSGQTKLTGFNKWDIIINYTGADNNYYTRWFPCSEEAPGDNQWQKARICLNGQPEFFEPDILNPEEELVILVKLSPQPADGLNSDVTIATPNGVSSSLSFFNPGYTLLVAHSDNFTIAGTGYHEIAEAALADGPAMIESASYLDRETGRKIMSDENTPSRLAKHLFPLTGISRIPATTWDVYYRCRTVNLGNIQDNEANFNIDVLIRKADGSIRETLASGIANVSLMHTEVDTWLTKNASYDFPGYTIIEDSDYLEIDYYADMRSNGANTDGFLQLMIDDSSLGLTNQTRIEA
jgi:hypothetical protein